MDRKEMWREYKELGPADFWKKRADEASSESAKEAFLQLAMVHEEPEPGRAILEIEQASEVADFVARGPTRRERFSWWLGERVPIWKRRIKGAVSFGGTAIFWPIRAGEIQSIVVLVALSFAVFWGFRFNHIDDAAVEFILGFMAIITGIIWIAVRVEAESSRTKALVGVLLSLVWAVPAGYLNFIRAPISPSPYNHPDKQFAFVMQGDQAVQGLTFGPDDWKHQWVSLPSPFGTSVMWVDGSNSYKARDHVYTAILGTETKARYVDEVLINYEISLAEIQPVRQAPNLELKRFAVMIAETVDRAIPDGELAASTSYSSAVEGVVSPLYKASNVSVSQGQRTIELFLWGKWRKVDVDPSELVRE